MHIGNQTFFPFPEYQYNADKNNNKNIFSFLGYHHKNADRKSIHFSQCYNPNIVQTTVRECKDPMRKVMELLSGFLSVKA
jgi:hypothetical protein